MKLELRIKQGDYKTVPGIADAPIDTANNNWCTLNHLCSADIDVAQVKCCGEPVTLRPNGIFVPCANCGHGYMIRDGYHDGKPAGHMHFFHKIEDVHIVLAYKQGFQTEKLQLKIGSPSGSLKAYAVDSTDRQLELAHVVCCRTEFDLNPGANALCPECQTYKYSLGNKGAKIIIGWEDTNRKQQAGHNSSAYHNSTRRFNAELG